ncbi:MAG TPA: MBL fold metallo-hydrolase [Capsulimonadaceae bacterium]|jgi:phosphoribosyl 1,2-cyclic phosphate phosphodiesterase
MKVTVLGSGTSHGVPMIACECAVCRSDNPKNIHQRSCLLVTADDGSNIIIDTPPEFRLMAVKHRIKRVDSVLYTHSHADHIFGLDDLRLFNWIQKQPIPLYGEQNTLNDIKRSFQYCFMETQKGGGKPQLNLHSIEPAVPLIMHGETITPLRVMHGSLPILAYKLGERAAYVTDVSYIPPETWSELVGLDTLLLDATRRQPHETHFHLAKSLEVVAALKPKRAYFVHLAHDYDYDTVNTELPDGVELAYDGLTFEA